MAVWHGPYGCSTIFAPKERNGKRLFISKASMANRSNAQAVNSSPASIAKSMIVRRKVYEDEMRGIVCYKDEKGETICEGYDEGPRYCEESSEITRQLEQQIYGFLQTGRLGISTDMDLFQFVQEQNKFYF
ncbi:hypothetical protein LUZ62_043963 [Rhynchospora pubera]|uniref:Uncharacterized protein n=1 Tax=Rhynchospora pubera TaxID=906938 RepID=A0AAV8CJT1_9POAL|nr:hypothetical protein LUZ62_088688 [Rhynchospora pubera]KAJ4792717.1 hypothetical protein LUZ62_043963 [Rhynchospora pubera]